MSLTPSRFAVQSWCFRHFKDSNARTAALVKQIGVSAIELCGVHVDFQNESAWDAAIKAYGDAAVDIVSIGVQTLTNNEPAARKSFEFTRRIGSNLMSVNFLPADMPGCLDLAQKLAEEYGVNLGIHNHGGRHWLGSRQMLTHILKHTSPRIGLCLDTAWALDSGEDPMSLIDAAGDRLFLVHIKDFIFGRDGRPEDVIVGTGNLDLPALVKKLDEKNFVGPAILEYEADMENPVPSLTRCVQAMMKAI